MRPGLRLALALLALAVAAPCAHAAFGHDPYSPVVVAPMAYNTLFGLAASDGSGGMLVAWSDQRGGNPDIYVQRYTGTGAVAAGWPAGGLLVCGAAGSQSAPALLGDGAGGAIVAWSDYRGSNGDIYASRVLGNATIAPGWPVNGLLLSTSGPSTVDDEYTPVLASDGAGGAFVVWTLHYATGDDDVYGARVSPAGTLQWSSVLYGPSGLQNYPRIIADGSSGLYVGFQDNENGSVTHAKVARYNSFGGTLWSPRYIGTGSSDQEGFDLATDGAGGVYVVCSDHAFGTYWNITGNHYMPNGSNDPNWGGGYKIIAEDDNVFQGSPLAIADGTGGLLTAFTDMRYGTPDLFVQHTGPYALPWAGWPTGGVALAVAAVNQFPTSMIPDGSGGAIVAMLDDRLNADYFAYAVRVLGNGSIAPGWAYGGNPVDLGGLINIGSYGLVAVPDGSGGALFAWGDTRNAPSYGYAGVYAQNMDRFGQLGDARPFITKIADVPNDQGGSVSLQWTASYLDANPSRTVTQYTIWRRVPGGTANAAVTAGAARTVGAASASAAAAGASSVAASASPSAARPAMRTTIEGNQVVYWEYVSTEPARMLPGYSVVVPTTSDSMTAGNPRTPLMVFAESPGGTMFWQSPADSGYSVDNIPPYAPAPFAGSYSSGIASLHWGAVVVADLANYRLYRGKSASFVPGPSNLIGSPVDTTFADAAGSPYYYRLTAVDIHGNESASTLLLPSGALAVGGGLPLELAFAAPEPNPARGATALKYSLPREATVRLAIYDVSGRRVRMLAEGAQPAGDHAATWDLRDAGGRAVGAGLYFARFEAEGRVFTRRVMAMR